MHSNRLVAALFFCLGGAALAITSWIIQRNGVMQAATADGREALGWAAIVVHVGGIVVFGLAAGALLKGRQRLGAALCGLMMLGAAVYSAWQIASFATSELISVTKAREAAEKRENVRNDAAIEAAKERQKTQADLAKAQLRWLQGTTAETRGRISRKDYVDAGNKLIAEIGKDAPATPGASAPPSNAVPLRTDSLAEWVANAVGWQQATLQASPTLWLALMLILIEVASWPLASYFWRRAPIIGGGAAPIAVPAERLPLEAAQPAALGSPSGQKALPAPVATHSADGGQQGGQQDHPDPDPPPARVHPAKAPAPVRIERRPISEEAARVLADIGFPSVRPAGPLRGREAPKEAARRFGVWLQAMGLDGRYSATEIATLYREFAEADHREPVSYNQLAGVMERVQGVAKRWPVEDGKQAMRWEIAPRRFRAKVQPPAPAIDPHKPETLPHNERLGPLTPSKQAEYDADRAAMEGGVVTRFPFGLAKQRLQTPPEKGEPAWLHENAKAMRRHRLAMNHKQRGSRIARRVA